MPESTTSIDRILVVGVTGAGKSTVAHQLAELSGLPHVELDVLHWGPNWTIRPEFLEEACSEVAAERWIIEGGYAAVLDRAWQRANLVIWLDYSFPFVLSRLFRRSITRVFRRKVLFAGNRESFSKTFLSRESLFIWLIKTYTKRKRQYTLLNEKYESIPVLRSSSHRQTAKWLIQRAPGLLGKLEPRAAERD